MAVDILDVELIDVEGCFVCIVIDCIEILLLNVEVIDAEGCFVFKTLVVPAWLGSKTKTSIPDCVSCVNEQWVKIEKELEIDCTFILQRFNVLKFNN